MMWVGRLLFQIQLPRKSSQINIKFEKRSAEIKSVGHVVIRTKKDFDRTSLRMS